MAHENIRIVTIIFSLCSGPTRSQSQAQAPAKAVTAQPQMKPTLPPPPSTHPLPSRKQQISQNKRWRYESYRLWMLWKTRLLKWSKDYKCCPPFYFQYKKIIPCVPQCMLLLGWPLIIIWRLKVLPPALFPALEYCISWHHTLLSLHWLLLLSIEGVDGYHSVHLGLPVWRHGGALVLGQNLACGLH